MPQRPKASEGVSLLDAETGAKLDVEALEEEAAGEDYISFLAKTPVGSLLELRHEDGWWAVTLPDAQAADYLGAADTLECEDHAGGCPEHASCLERLNAAPGCACPEPYPLCEESHRTTRK